ncbi:hypothetical protein RHIZ404_230562 [Rhizobium sp. EC-SD404]|nr:hypothetical protein RHIZ404_230562 [Rhizobium sp. EC-SD404]
MLQRNTGIAYLAPQLVKLREVCVGGRLLRKLLSMVNLSARTSIIVSPSRRSGCGGAQPFPSGMMPVRRTGQRPVFSRQI